MSEGLSQGWKRPVWIALLVVASVAFSFLFKCAAPFAAFAAIAACTLPRRAAYSLVGAVWLANQAVGFGFLHYPWTASCLTWGAAIGITAMLSTLAAELSMRPVARFGTFAQISVSFLAAFAAYELALMGFSTQLGGLENYTAAIVGRIFGVNAVALVGLFAMEQVGVAAGLAPSTRLKSPVVSA